MLQTDAHHPRRLRIPRPLRRGEEKDDTPLRDRIKAYLGGNTTYYRYHHGERLLTPEQQQWILDLFHRHGYTDGLHFDEYRDLYDFSD